MQEKRRFIEAVLASEYTMTELCQQFGISRKTGFKWWARFKARGVLGLAELARAPHSHPNATSEEVVGLIITARRAHPTWGPRKLRAWLAGRGHEAVVPAVSTIGSILKREGLVRPRRRRMASGDYSSGLSDQDAPNAVWAADFKGWFKLRNGRKCYPLTISDGFSRYLLRCQALFYPDDDSSREVFETAFHEFGLPAVLRTDNGVPFSTTTGISPLSLWWIKLGITPERIERGKPTQNGRHERIHRTLKAEAIKSEGPKASLWAQQRVFDRFRREYNEERPHEALRDRPPAKVYRSSPRRYPRRLREPEYTDDHQVQRADRDGAILVDGRRYLLAKLLSDEPIGLLEQTDGDLDVHYGPLRLATISARGRLRRGAKSPRSKPGSRKQETEESKT